MFFSFAAVLLCAMIIGSQQQVVVPAYYPSYYPSVYSPYVAAAAYPSVWAWGSNKNKDDSEAPRAFSRPTLLNNQKPTSA